MFKHNITLSNRKELAVLVKDALPAATVRAVLTDGAVQLAKN